MPYKRGSYSDPRSFSLSDYIMVQFVQKLVIKTVGKIAEDDGADGNGSCDKESRDDLRLE
jgi:hypothetical protein